MECATGCLYSSTFLVVVMVVVVVVVVVVVTVAVVVDVALVLVTGTLLGTLLHQQFFLNTYFSVNLQSALVICNSVRRSSNIRVPNKTRRTLTEDNCRRYDCW